MTYLPIKRALDLVGAASLLVLTAPVMGATAVAVARSLGRPVLFKQERPGMEGRIFTLYKFRSMTDVDPSRGMVTDEQRLIPFGRALRSTSLDELPSLWNVLKGDMSFVGPRPLLVSYLDRYTPRQARRHAVRPGITGLAQVSGRNELPWDERFELDVHYVDHVSVRLDLTILWRTVAAVVGRQGISEEGKATMSEFLGAATPADTSERRREERGKA